MRRSGGRIARPLDRSEAWSCLAANLLALPGLGSVAAGRRAGYAQMALALVGFGLTLLWVGGLAWRWAKFGEPPRMGGWRFWAGLGGIAAFAAAWAWALGTSLELLRQSREQRPNASAATDPKRPNPPPVL